MLFEDSLDMHLYEGRTVGLYPVGSDDKRKKTHSNIIKENMPCVNLGAQRSLHGQEFSLPNSKFL